MELTYTTGSRNWYMEMTIEGRRKQGRPKTRWKDCVTLDARSIGERTWMRLAMDTDGWKILLRKARAHNGLSCHL